MRYNVILRGTAVSKHSRLYEKTGTTYYNIGFDTEEGTETIPVTEDVYPNIQLNKLTNFIAQVNTQPMYNGRMGSVLRITGIVPFKEDQKEQPKA